MSVSQNFPIIAPSLLLDFSSVQALDPRITYARATTATYYGTRTALAEQNLYYPSNTLNGGIFVNRRVTLTANSTAAPDGTTTASLVAEDTNTNSHGIDGNVGYNAGTSYTKSVFVKKGTGATAPDIIQVAVSTSALAGSGYVNFNISSGTITASSVNVTGSIVSAGSGWYRCIVTFIATATISPFNDSLIYFTNNNPTAGFSPSYAGQTTSDIFVWGAQFETRSTVTAYTPTTTQAITNYIPILETAASNVARFDHNPTTFESLGLLIEQQSTNLVLQSENFQTTWTTQRSSVLANQAIAPDGTLTGDKLIASTAATTTHNLFQSYSLSASTFTLSCYAKAGEYSGFRLYWTEGVNPSADFNLLTGTVVSAGAEVTATITPVGNGWYRCIYTKTNAGTGSNPVLSVGLNGSTFSYTGDGYSGIYIWGAQLEAGAFATSYIPTVASQVTRAADSASITGTNFTSWFNNAEFSLYQDIQFQSGSPVRFGDSFANNIETIRNNTFSAGVYGTLGNTAFPTQLYTTAGSPSYPAGTFVANQRQVAAFAMSLNSFASGYSGVGATATPTYNPAAATFSGLYFGGTNLGANYSGRIRKIAYYPKALTATQIQALTT